MAYCVVGMDKRHAEGLLVLLCYKALSSWDLWFRASNLKVWVAVWERAGLALWPIYTGWCARPWRAGGRCPLFTMVATACFVRTDWEGTRKGSSECFAISTAEKANPA